MNKENHVSPNGTSPVTQKRVAIFTRTACDTAQSTPLQEWTCRNYFEHGDRVALDEFFRAEAGKSGATLEDRPMLSLLLSEANKQPRPFDILLVDDSSRPNCKLAR